MEILKVGNVFTEVKFVKKCKKCKTHFVYNSSDLFTNSACLDLYVSCPMCEETLKVSRFDKRYNSGKHGELMTVQRKIGFNRW